MEFGKYRPVFMKPWIKDKWHYGGYYIATFCGTVSRLQTCIGSKGNLKHFSL